MKNEYFFVDIKRFVLYKLKISKIIINKNWFNKWFSYRFSELRSVSCTNLSCVSISILCTYFSSNCIFRSVKIFSLFSCSRYVACLISLSCSRLVKFRNSWYSFSIFSLLKTRKTKKKNKEIRNFNTIIKHYSNKTINYYTDSFSYFILLVTNTNYINKHSLGFLFTSFFWC